MSLFYTATRPDELTDAERTAIEKTVREYSDTDPSWEMFWLYDPPLSAPDLIVEGATGLPGSSADDCWAALQHWCRLLSEIRRILPDATWHVHVDDHDIQWNAERQEYDPAT